MLDFMMPLTKMHWFCIAAGFGILEVLLGASFFLLLLGLSALTIGFLLMFFPGLIWQHQLLIFAIESVLFISLWHLHLQRSPQVYTSSLNRRGEQYLNREFTLIEPMVNGRSRIKVDDSFWVVAGNEDLPAGSKVKIIDVDGTVLKVIKVDEGAQHK